MNWEAFQEAHFRPHLALVRLVDVDPNAATTMIENWFEGSFNAPSNYAVKQDQQELLIAFELYKDVEKFTVALRGTPMASASEWASRTEVRLDAAACTRLARIDRRKRKRQCLSQRVRAAPRATR
jgi:hypothetical protein